MSPSDKEKELGRILDMRDTVLFVGSGLSIWAGLPNWTQLIKRLIAFVESRTGIAQAAARRSFDDHDLLVAADYLLNRIKRAELADFLINDAGFGNARPHWIHKLLSDLGPKCILTTNYDRLIELQFANSEPLKVITNRQVADFADIVRSDAKNFLFKIHGSIDDAASIVISETDYHESILNHFQGGSRSVFETLKIIMATRPVVFLGYGIKDIDFILILRFLQQTFDRNVGRYWAILSDITGEEADRLWDRYRIRTLSYVTSDDGKDHSSILRLLERLVARPQVHAPPTDDNAATILAIGRYGSHLSKMDPGPGIELTAYLNDWDNPLIQETVSRYQNATIQEILNGIQSSFVLQGPAGSGKSFSIRRYLSRCGEVLQGWALADHPRNEAPVFPILLDARLYSGNFNALASAMLPAGLAAHDIIGKVQPTIIIDSLDEMPSEYLDSGTWGADLRGFAENYGDCRVIFGTRRADLVLTKGLPVFHVSQLRKSVVDNVLADAGIRPEKIGENLREALQNPFVLSLAPRFLRSKSGSNTPDSLFKAFLEHSIAEIEVRVSASEVFDALHKLAWDAMARGRDTISTTDIEVSFAGIARADGHASGRLVDQFVARGLFVSELDERVRFVHRTILEYLAAKELASRFLDNKLSLADILSSRRWDNVVAWSAVFLPTRKLEQLISKICIWDKALALRVADSAEMKREHLLNHVLRNIIKRRPKQFQFGDQTRFVFSRISFPKATKRNLESLSNRKGALSGVAASALVPFFSQSEARRWLRRACSGEVPFNDSNDLGAPLGARLSDRELNYFLNLIGALKASDFKNHDIDHAIETIIEGMSLRHRSFLRDWSRHKSEAIRAVVASTIEHSDERDDLEFLVEQWTLGLSTLSFSLFASLKYSTNPHKEHLFGVTENRLKQLRRFLVGRNSEDRQWTLELLRIAVEKFPDWKAAIEGMATTERDIFSRRAYQLAVPSSRPSAVKEILDELQTGTGSANTLTLIVMFDKADWKLNASQAIKLLQSDDARVVSAVADELDWPGDGPMRALTSDEIDCLLDRLSFWNSQQENRDIWFAKNRIQLTLAKLIDMSGCQHLLVQANTAGSHRKLILGLVLPAISSTMITTDDLTEESCQIMLDEYLENPSVDSFANSPGSIATEAYIERYVLPAGARLGRKKARATRLRNILVEAGNRHGRRYQIQGH